MGHTWELGSDMWVGSHWLLCPTSYTSQAWVVPPTRHWAEKALGEWHKEAKGTEKPDIGTKEEALTPDDTRSRKGSVIGSCLWKL